MWVLYMYWYFIIEGFILKRWIIDIPRNMCTRHTTPLRCAPLSSGFFSPHATELVAHPQQKHGAAKRRTEKRQKGLLTHVTHTWEYESISAYYGHGEYNKMWVEEWSCWSKNQHNYFFWRYLTLPYILRVYGLKRDVLCGEGRFVPLSLTSIFLSGGVEKYEQ